MRQSIHKPLPAECSGGDKRPIIRNPDPPDWYEVEIKVKVQVQNPTNKKEIVEALKDDLITGMIYYGDFEIVEWEMV